MKTIDLTDEEAEAVWDAQAAYDRVRARWIVEYCAFWNNQPWPEDGWPEDGE